MNALAAVDQSTSAPVGPDKEHIAKLQTWMVSDNIAPDLDEDLVKRIGMTVYREYQIDDNSRADWKTKSEEAMNLALQIAKEKSFPWPQAANIIYPLVTTAAMQFAARAYPAIINGRNVARGVVIGSDNGTPAVNPQTGQPMMQPGPVDPQSGQSVPVPVWAIPPGAKQVRADTLGEHMSYQLLDEMPEWEPETDQLLHRLPIIGCDFRKSYFDPGKGRNVSVLVSAMHLVVNYKARSLETAPRLTEEIQFYPNEIEENFRSGIWMKPKTEFGIAQNADGDDDAPHEFLEQHRYLDLDEDGYAEPYIVTIHKTSQQVVRVVARYDADGIHFSRKDHRIAKIDPIHYYTKYDFIPNPDGGIYSLGFGQLLRPINEGINTVLNQLLDAGTLQNTGGGFIGKGLSMNAGAIRFQLGEYKTVNVTGGTLKENIVPMNWPGPSPVLFNLLGMLVESGKEIAAIKDVLTGDQQNANVPATTTLALIEQGLKVFTAIYKRVHRALKAELAKLYRLNMVYGDQVSEYKVGDTWKQVLKEDYQKGSGVEPVSDPTMVSDMQRMGRAQFLLTLRGDPNMNGVAVLKRVLTAADIEKIDELINEQGQPNPAVAIKGMELDLKDKERADRAQLTKAQSLNALAGAINQLAQADKTVGDQHLQWLDMQLTAWQQQHSADTAATKNADGTSSPGGEGPPPPHMEHPANMPAPSDNIQPDISDTDTMSGGIRGDDNGNLRISPQSQFAQDHSGAQ